MSRCFFRTCLPVAALALGAVSALHAQDPRATLDKGVKATGLTGEGIPAWHLKADYTLYDIRSGKPIENGTMEQWSTGQHTWHRVYTEKKQSAQEWSTARTRLLRSKDSKLDLVHLDDAVAQPLLDPVSAAANYKPSVELSGQAGSFEGMTLACVQPANPAQAAGNIDPDALFPRLCFDATDATLKFTTTSTTIISYADFKPLGDRKVATKVEIKPYNHLGTEIHVTALEPLAASDQAQVTPPSNAVEMPYPHRLSDGLLVPVKLTECAYPMDARDAREHGPVSVPIAIKKDGSVKPLGPGIAPQTPHLAMAIGDCVGNYKFEPFKIDGEPTEVSDVLTYDYETKAFTPAVVTLASQPAKK
jgi:hypothetical protein